MESIHRQPEVLHLISWLSRDDKILPSVRPFQSFSASLVSIFLAIYLSLIGLPLWKISLVLMGGLLCSTIFNTVAGFMADRMGRRRMLVSAQ